MKSSGSVKRLLKTSFNCSRVVHRTANLNTSTNRGRIRTILCWKSFAAKWLTKLTNASNVAIRFGGVKVYGIGQPEDPSRYQSRTVRVLAESFSRCIECRSIKPLDRQGSTTARKIISRFLCFTLNLSDPPRCPTFHE